MKRALRIALLALPALSACSPPADDRPVVASVIGTTPRIVDPSQKPMTPADALLLAQTAQGLVRFDASGQIQPGLAIRWDVSDDGLYYTFRLADGSGIDAEQAARWLRALIGPTSRNPLKPVLGAVAEIVAVTPEVIEIRLTAPRPDLLSLIAQPEMAILNDGGGTGPYRIAARVRHSLLLAPTGPMAATVTDDDNADAAIRQPGRVTLIADRAASAVARFQADRTALVLGGRFADLPVARASGVSAPLLHFDPVGGLFGLVVAGPDAFVGASGNRRALAMAIDRDRIAGLFGTGWRAATTLLPAGLPDRPTPALPDWNGQPVTARHEATRAVVAEWSVAHGAPVIRVAMPAGPGARMLFRLMQSDWRAIGVTALPVEAGSEADLKLVDLVAPGDSASWYLRQFECVRASACSADVDAALTAARIAPSLAIRNGHLAEADARLAEASLFIPLALPLRWSLVSRRLAGYQDNKRAAHPLDQLRGSR